MQILMSIFGIVVILLTAFILSSDRRSINYRTVVGAFIIQAFFAFFALYVPFGQKILEGAAIGISTAISAGTEGVSFVFGPLASSDNGFVLATAVLAIIVFFSSLISVLYYIRIMPLIINTIGLVLHKILRTSRAESMSAAANVFVGMSEAPIVVKPYLNTMTRSEVFAVMVGGLASVSGGVLAGYAALGLDMKVLVAAAFMAAPGGLLMAKIMIPETGTPLNTIDDTDAAGIPIVKPANIIEAAANGATTGLQMALNIGAMLVAFIGLITLANYILGSITGLFGYSVTIQLILGYFFAPVAFIIGIPFSEIVPAGALLGEKLIFNEFVAYIHFMQEIETFSPRSQILITFALTGFANFGSIGILVGGMGLLAPKQRQTIITLAMKAMIAASLANFLSATLAGLILSL